MTFKEYVAAQKSGSANTSAQKTPTKSNSGSGMTFKEYVNTQKTPSKSNSGSGMTFKEYVAAQKATPAPTPKPTPAPTPALVATKPKTFEGILNGANFGKATMSRALEIAKEPKAKAPNIMDYIQAPLKGYAQSHENKELWEDVSGLNHTTDPLEYMLDTLVDTEVDYEPRNWIEETALGALGQIGNMAYPILHPRTIAGAGIGAGVAFAAGQAGAQVAAPEEIATVPGLAVVGAKVAGATLAYQVEAGAAYDEMVKKGVSPEKAEATANLVGTGNALLEVVQIDELIDISKFLIKNKATRNFGAEMLKTGLKWLINTGMETAEELLQEINTILGVQAASKMDTGEYAYDTSEVLGRIADTAKNSLLQFGLISGVPAAVNVSRNAYNSIKSSKAQTAPTTAATTPTTPTTPTAPTTAATAPTTPAIAPTTTTTPTAPTTPAIAPTAPTTPTTTPTTPATPTYANKIPDVTYNDAQVQEFIERAPEIASEIGGEKGREAFVRAYTPEIAKKISAGDALGGFFAIYESAKGKAVNADLLSFGNSMPQELITAAKEAAMLDSATTAQNPGFIKNEYSQKIGNKTIRALDAIGKKLGVEIEIGAPTGTGNGAYNGKYENGRITIAADADNPLKVVLAHEVTHHMRRFAPAEYFKFAEMAINAAEKLNAVEKSELITRYKERYSKETQTEFGEDAAIEEIAADYSEKLVDDIELFRELVRADKNVAQRFLESVKEFIAKVKSTFSNDKTKADTAALEKYGVKVSELEEVIKQWEAMVKETKTAVKNGNVEIENTAGAKQSGGRKYDLKKDARQNVDKAISQKGYNGEIELTTGSPSIITSQKGTKNYPLVMKASHIRENILTEKEAQAMGLKVNKDINYHGLGKELFIEVIQDLDNVNLAYRGTKNADNPERRENYFLLISQKRDADGNVINVPVYINENAKIGKNFIEANKVATVYGKEKLNKYISEQIQKGNLVRIKNRSINASEGSSPINDHYNKDASTDSIPETTEKSNPQFSSKKNTDNQGRELSAEQAEYFKDSKVRDKDGNLVTVYHGTSKDFNIFENGHKRTRGALNFGEGNYFTPSKAMAENYVEGDSPRIIEAYLNIQNPYEVFGTSFDQDDYKKVSAELGGHSVVNKENMTENLKRLGYDGVIARSYNGTDNPIFSVVAFESSQIKNIDNKTPTENPDIRYSLKGKKPIEPDAERKAERERMRELEAENAQQKKLIEQLKDRMKDMRPNRIAGQVDEKAVRKAAREIVQRYSATVKPSELAPKLKKLWDTIGTGKDLSWEEVSAEAKAIATEIAESAVEKDDTLYQEFAELRKYARKTTFTISESDRSNISDFADFRKRNMGRMNIANGKTNIDMVYKELGEMYPGMFDEERITHPADQLLHIAEVLNNVYDITESNPFKNNMDYAVGMIANDILETFYEIPENKKTFEQMKIQRLERTILERNAQVKETQKILNQYHKSVEKMLLDYNKKQDEIAKEKKALGEEREKFYEKQDEKKKRAQIIRATNSLSQKLRWSTDKKHIPQELQGAVARFLEYVNLTGLYTYDEKGKLQKSDDGTPTKKNLTNRELKAIYQKYDGEFTFPDEFFEGVYEDGKERGNILERVYELRDTRVAAMNKDQLDIVLQGVKIVETAVKNADKMFSDSRFKEISSLAENIKDNAPIKNKFIEHRFKSMLKQILDIDNLTPQAFFHRLGAGGDAIFNMLSDAEAKRTRITKEVGAFTEKLLDQKTRRELEKNTVMVKLGGENVEMSIAQIMELYALSRRKQAEKHILEGGVVIEGIPGKKGEKRREPIRASVREIGEAINNLTPEQRKLAEQLSKFASDKLGGYMNEACKKVFGYEKFGEINYWPIRIDDRTIHKKADTADAAKATPTIRNFGMAKGLTHGANNALKIGSIFDTFAEHASQSATYAAYLGAMEDMRRVINYTYGNGEGMQHVLDGVFGIHEKKVNGKVEDTHPGIDYWNKLYEDINGGMKAKDGGSPFDPFLRNKKLTSVAANSRVVIQQPTAYIRAASEIDPEYLAEGTLHAKRGWERALKYAPIAQQKEWGRADIGTGQTMKEILFGLDGAIPKIQEYSMWLAGKADAAAWGSLWSACEAEVKAKNKKIKPNSEAFYDAVAKRFTQIINKTQVVDGVLQRSQNMRKQNALVKLGTMYMSEPTKQYNMIASAVYDLAHADSKEKKKAAKKTLARTANSVVVATVINAAAQSIVDAMRDDDKEKKYWEKWLSAFLGLPDEDEKGIDAVRSIAGGNLAEGLNPISYFPFAKDIWSFMQGYDVNRPDVEGIGDFVNALINVLQTLSGNSKQSIPSGLNELIAAGATMFGIPYASFKREISSVSKSIIQGIGNPVLEYQVQKLTKNIKNKNNAGDFIDILYDAKQKDKEAYDIIYKDMVKNGFKKEDIDEKIDKYTSSKFDRALSAAKKAKESEKATTADKIIYRHLNREKNISKDERAGEGEEVLDNLDKYRASVEKYLKEYPGKDEEKAIDYAYLKANYELYGAKYAIRASGKADTYKKAEEKVNRGNTTWEKYYNEYFGKTERRYDAIKKYGVSYSEFEKIEDAISKNKKKEDAILAIQKLGYKYGVASKIREIYTETK